MAAKLRKADSKARVTLFEDFANATVMIERVSADEIRVRRIPSGRRFTLAELLAGVTRENRHGEIATGPSQGIETW